MVKTTPNLIMWYGNYITVGCGVLDAPPFNSVYKKVQKYRISAPFGVFCLLLGGSTYVRHPLTKCKILFHFSKSVELQVIRPTDLFIEIMF